MSDFVSLGELLIDFTPSGEKKGQKLYMQNAGGAVSNVAAAVAGFGVSSSFIGMVGNDFFGRYLEEVLRGKGVDTSGLVLSDEYLTTLAFVHLFENGQRDFTFYRRPGADTMYDKKYLDFDMIKKAKVFHFGSLSLTDEPARSATFEALEFAKKNGVIISYDPNYRAPLWKDEKTAKEYMMRGMEYADILKLADNEAELLFGNISYEGVASKLLDMGVKLVFITMGSEGAIYASKAGIGKIGAYKADAVDTTGAGDCFTASVVCEFIKSGKKLSDLTADDIKGFTNFACAAASICVESMGGIPSLPTLELVKRRIK